MTLVSSVLHELSLANVRATLQARSRDMPSPTRDAAGAQQDRPSESEFTVRDLRWSEHWRRAKNSSQPSTPRDTAREQASGGGGSASARMPAGRVLVEGEHPTGEQREQPVERLRQPVLPRSDGQG